MRDRNKNPLNKEIKVLNKIDAPIVNFSEKHCQNIDFQTAIKSLPLISDYLDNIYEFYREYRIKKCLTRQFHYLLCSLQILRGIECYRTSKD